MAEAEAETEAVLFPYFHFFPRLPSVPRLSRAYSLRPLDT